MTKIVIVYHSVDGHTAKQAEAVAESANADLIIIDAEGNIPEQAWETLNGADAIIFGSPTYMGTVSWQFKKFADASLKAWSHQAWKDKIFSGFTSSASLNGDKHSTLHYFITLAMQHSGIWVGLGIKGASAKANTREDINYLGAYAGLMMQTPIDAGPEQVNPGDLETARLFGVRISDVTRQFKAK